MPMPTMDDVLTAAMSWPFECGTLADRAKTLNSDVDYAGSESPLTEVLSEITEGVFDSDDPSTIGVYPVVYHFPPSISTPRTMAHAGKSRDRR